MLTQFFSLNRQLCRKIEPLLPQNQPNILELYEKLVAKYMNTKPNQTIVDVGGGSFCPFAKYKKLNKTRIIAVDFDSQSLSQNQNVDEKKVADITQNLPFKPKSIDIITSRWVLEHLKETEKFISLSQKVLKKGGYAIHLFSNRYAPFALFGKLLPPLWKKKLLYFLNRGIKDEVGLPTYYRNCSLPEITALFQKYHFSIKEIYFGYYQSQYYDFFLPFFLFSSLYEFFLFKFQIKNLAPYLLVVAQVL